MVNLQNAPKGGFMSKINRRKFLRKIAIIGIGSTFIPSLFSNSNKKKKRKLIVLHTNDFHSRIDAFPANHPKYPNQGGIRALKGMIDEVKSENTNVLLLDCGDIIQGTPYFNLFGGNVEIEWMNKIGYHASTLGNHDFDGGIENLKKLIEKAKFPFINCNYGVKNTVLANKLLEYKIVKINNLKIGITGVGIDPQGLIPDHLCKGVTYLDPIEQVNKIAKTLKEEKHCDFVICISHLGFEYKNDQVSDKVLATKTRNVDLILGGHTHTFLDAPISVENLDKKKVLVNQAGWAGLRLGKIEITF